MTDSLLPPSATAQQRALEATMARAEAIVVPLRDLWSWERCPVALLGWLAWQLAVPEWSPEWDEATKREVIRRAPSLHRASGTPWAVRTSLEAAGFGPVTLVEGRPPVRYDGTYRYNGQVTYGDGNRWAAYEVHLEADGMVDSSPMALARLRRLASYYAPARCRLEVIRVAHGDEAESMPVTETFAAVGLAEHSDVWPGPPRYDGTRSYGAGLFVAAPTDPMTLEVLT